MAWPKAQANNLTLRIVARIISASTKDPKQKILNEFNSRNEVKLSMRTIFKNKYWSHIAPFSRPYLVKVVVQLIKSHRLISLTLS